MKITCTILGLIFTVAQLISQPLQDSRVAYTFVSSLFENAIIEALDDDKLSSKEEKLFTKFKNQLALKTISHFETYLTAQLKEKSVNILPLTSVENFSNNATNANGYPSIIFPKYHQEKSR